MTPRERYNAVLRIVAEEYRLPVRILFERDTFSAHVKARRAAYVALRDVGANDKQIARFMKRNRATITLGIERHEGSGSHTESNDDGE